MKGSPTQCVKALDKVVDNRKLDKKATCAKWLMIRAGLKVKYSINGGARAHGH